MVNVRLSFLYDSLFFDLSESENSLIIYTRFYCINGMPELGLTINDGSKPLKYTANDWFYMKTNTNDVCEPESENSKSCYENKCAVSDLQMSTDSLGASLTQYNDAKMLYNRELLFTVNILAGLVLICYYAYMNQSAIPSPASVMQSVGATGTLVVKSSS